MSSRLRLLVRGFVVFCAAWLGLVDGASSPPSLWAQQPAPAADPPPIVVPDGSPAELLAFIDKIKRERPPTNDYLEAVRHMLRIQEAVIAAVDKLAAAKPGETEATQGVSEKIAALMLLARLNAPGADARLKGYLDELVIDPRPFVPPLAKIYQLATRLQALDHNNHAEVEQLAADVRAHVRAAKPDMRNLSVAFQTARGVEQSGLNVLAGEMYSEFAAYFAKSDDPQVVERAKKLEGAARLATLVGKTIELQGKQLDGTPFDLKSYRGKTVLVDFFATWSGPWVAELPNLKTAYAKYHERGFEVVGISLDNEKDRVETFVKRESVSWPTLFSDDHQATGWNHPLAQYYGVMAIPQSILVDKDGKVVSLAARGEELWDLLAQQIGPAEVKPPAAPEVPPAGEKPAEKKPGG
jgi:peroxiredoxin